jgi:hypothetical protein
MGMIKNVLRMPLVPMAPESFAAIQGTVDAVIGAKV